MGFLEDIFEQLFDPAKRRGWGGGHHGRSGHHGQGGYPRPVVCPRCNAENEPANTFCSACGTELGLGYQKIRQPVSCLKCGAENDSASAFCAACGTKLSEAAQRSCSACSAHVPADARFCPRCGHPISAK